MTTKTMHIFYFLRSQKKITVLLLGTMFIWVIGFPLWINGVNAADVTSFSDTLSDSDASVVSNHLVRFTISNTGTLTSGEYMSLAFESFNVDSINVDDVDMLVNGTHEDLSANWTISTSSNTVIITSAGAGGTLSADDVVAIYIGTNATSTADGTGPGANQIINPGLGSKTVTLAGNMDDSGTTRVAIIDDVAMTASVDTTFTFNIYGVATNTAPFNGDTSTTSASTTPTAIAFGTLTAGTSELAAQRLTVSTNAANGFSVTMQQDTNLVSASTADIDTFVDGDATTTPLAWQSPSETAGDEWTYGHYGVTSEDHSLSWGAGNDPFGAASSLYVGQFSTTTPLEIMYHTGVSNGSGDGETYVGIRIETSALQEAANDYSNTLTYIATPVF
ncbi:MAG: hypothetical protein KAS07_00890 [Candidatus Pacebacteria bacterium]|nr:hypothetical protein [Candidatus Paceibacterota bacterium]